MRYIILAGLIGFIYCFGSAVTPSFAAISAESATIETVRVQDQVIKLKELEAEYEVLFQNHSGVYHLFRNNPSFSVIFEGLVYSKALEKPVTIVADSRSMAILLIEDSLFARR
ncbi:MAG TPA: hypothetical protein VJB59_08010 [Bdellovibrionota bacterium]|nr:hypothetical protein [Bdellovibrionota bacterium]